MFWYKPANLAFDLEKLFIDRFFAAAREGGGLRHHTWQQENEILDQGFGLNLSANQMAREGGFTSSHMATGKWNFRPRIWFKFISQSDGRILTYKKNHFEKRQCGSTDCSVVVSGRKIRSQSCVRLHCISFTALATASCQEIKIEKETLGTDNLF